MTSIEGRSSEKQPFSSAELGKTAYATIQKLRVGLTQMSEAVLAQASATDSDYSFSRQETTYYVRDQEESGQTSLSGRGSASLRIDRVREEAPDSSVSLLAEFVSNPLTRLIPVDSDTPFTRAVEPRIFSGGHIIVEIAGTTIRDNLDALKHIETVFPEFYPHSDAIRLSSQNTD
jgi:hypothetical protein